MRNPLRLWRTTQRTVRNMVSCYFSAKQRRKCWIWSTQHCLCGASSCELRPILVLCTGSCLNIQIFHIARKPHSQVFCSYILKVLCLKCWSKYSYSDYYEDLKQPLYLITFCNKCGFTIRNITHNPSLCKHVNTRKLFFKNLVFNKSYLSTKVVDHLISEIQSFLVLFTICKIIPHKNMTIF